MVGDSDRALVLIDRARDLNPNFATVWYASGTVRAFRGGEPDRAIDHLTRAIRLSPFDPLMFAMLGMMAFAHVCVGRYDEAAGWAEKAVLERPNVAATLRGAVVSNALAGRRQEAERALERLLELDPGLRVRDVRNRTGSFGRPEDLARYEEGLRRARSAGMNVLQSARANGGVPVPSRCHVAVTVRSRRGVEMAVRSGPHDPALSCGSSMLATTTMRLTLPALYACRNVS